MKTYYLSVFFGRTLRSGTLGKICKLLQFRTFPSSSRDCVMSSPTRPLPDVVTMFLGFDPTNWRNPSTRKFAQELILATGWPNHGWNHAGSPCCRPQIHTPLVKLGRVPGQSPSIINHFWGCWLAHSDGSVHSGPQGLQPLSWSTPPGCDDAVPNASAKVNCCSKWRWPKLP